MYWTVEIYRLDFKVLFYTPERRRPQGTEHISPFSWKLRMNSRIYMVKDVLLSLDLCDELEERLSRRNFLKKMFIKS